MEKEIRDRIKWCDDWLKDIEYINSLTELYLKVELIRATYVLALVNYLNGIQPL